MCFFDRAKDAQAFLQVPGRERKTDGGAIGFVVRRFKNVRNAEIGGDRAELFGHAGGVRFGFDHARAGDQKQRRAWARIGCSRVRILLAVDMREAKSSSDGTDYAGTGGNSTLNCVGRKEYRRDAEDAEKGEKINTRTRRKAENTERITSVL